MNFHKKVIKFFLIILIFSYSGVFAAGIDHFEVIFTPDSANVGEAIDLEIEAVDKNNQPVLDYQGTILIFSESDADAELPSSLEDNSFSFSASDQGKIKFENAIKFKTAGTQDIYIYDLNDDTVFGVAEAEITEEVIIQNIDINIISPENGLTIGKQNILVSGNTQKNHQIKLFLNGIEKETINSNNSGVFEKDINNLSEGTNILKAVVYDADLNEIGVSDEIQIKVELSNLNIKNVKITPEEINPENSFEIEVISNPQLDTVNVIINDVLIKLEEKSPGVYSGKLYGPKEVGDYTIDVSIKDELGHEKTELGVSNLTVIELKSAPQPVVVTENTSTGEVTEEKVCDTYPDLEITGLKLVELKTKSILTWDKIENISKYNIYRENSNGAKELITNVTEPKFEIEITGEEIKYNLFTVKAIGENNCGETFESKLSDATKVQTGPQEIILLILSLLIGGGVFILKNKKA